MQPPAQREPIIVREASRTTIVLVLVATFGLITAVFLPGIITRLSSLGDTTLALVVFAAIFVVAIGGVAVLQGGLRPRDVGLRWDRLLEGLIVVAIVWILIQAAHAIAALVSTGSIQWHGDWHRSGAGVLAWLAAMLFGTALAEETIFRGFVFPQLHLKCAGSQRARFWMAATAAAILFGLFHVPRHIVFADMAAVALVVRILAHALGGILATAMYLRTRNLWIVIGLHGIENAPTRLVESPMPSEILLPIEIALLLAWPWITRRPHHRGFAAVVRDAEGRSAAQAHPSL